MKYYTVMTARGLEAIRAAEAQVFDAHPEIFHYTSISALRGIVETNALWATHVRHLNDSSETDIVWSRLNESVVEICEAAIEDYVRRYPEKDAYIRNAGGATKISAHDARAITSKMRSLLVGEDGVAVPFVVSFTTHDDDSHRDDYCRHGMLSQWRGYGGSDCVAVVFDTKELQQLLERECERFEYGLCLISDVIYDKEDVALPERFPELSNKLKSFVQNFIENKDDRAVEKIIHDFTPDLFSAIVRSKHYAFNEERECRIVAALTPESLRDRFAKFGESPKAFKRVHFRSGVCGSIPYIRLFEDLDAKLPITRIVVGPSRNQAANLEVVRSLVGTKEVVVQASEIPFVGSA